MAVSGETSLHSYLCRVASVFASDIDYTKRCWPGRAREPFRLTATGWTANSEIDPGIKMTHPIFAGYLGIDLLGGADRRVGSAWVAGIRRRSANKAG
jgi:hypothetical protein